jgi:hemolysin activation/secretion protein
VGEAPCFPIHALRLAGEHAETFAFSLVALTQGSGSVLGQCLGTQGIQGILAQVQNAIIAKGYVTTRVMAAPQDLNSGELVLSVIPGKVRNIRWAEGSDERATWRNALPLKPGDILNLRDLEQGLENFKRLPTADADLQITPAQGPDAKPGESDLVIAWRQRFPFRVMASLDDSGSKATGKRQGGITVAYDHMLALNDLFYVSLNQDVGNGDSALRGTRGHTVHYSIPWGYGMLALTGSEFQYHQSVSGLNQTYRYSGQSANQDIQLSRLVYRDATQKTTLHLRGWVRRSRNFIDDTEVEVQRRQMAGWELGASHRMFIAAAILEGNVAYRRGTGAFGALPAPEESFGEGSSRMKLLTAELSLDLPFTLGDTRLRYLGVLRGQWNGTALVPQDRFSIGGRYTVRGFDGENTLAADRGWLVRNDLGLLLGASGAQAYLGIDYGEVAGPSAERLLGKRLAGAVIGLRGGYKGVSYDIFLGQALQKPEGFRTASTTAGFRFGVAL